MSNEELRREQEFVDVLHARLEELRAEATAAVEKALGPSGTGHQARVEREVLVGEQSALLAAFDAGEHGLCFGRLVFRDGRDHHIGRIGIRRDDAEHTPLVLDWRADVARPFYLATGHTPMGLRRRRHITSEGLVVTALHDEILDLSDPLRTGHESADADEVLLAALDSARTGRMHDIVQTIQADQDRIIRAPHQGLLVVEGGPGTGKTVVALHRAAYLLYAYREHLARRAVLVVGPNPTFLRYIGDVLPALGETGVLFATPGELFPGVTATGVDTPAAAEIKGRAEMADALAEFVRDQQRLPDPALVIAHDDGELYLDADIASDARHAARGSLLPHNLARPYFAAQVVDGLAAQLVDRIGADPYGGPNLLGAADVAQLTMAVAASSEVHAAIAELWPVLTPEELLADYLTDPVHIDDADAALIRRSGGAWTPADVALLDEAAELLGVDDSAARAAAEADRLRRIAYAQGVLDMTYGSRTQEFEDREDEDSEVLSAHDLVDAERLAERHEEADHRTAAERAAADRTWAFGHIIVDEAQELSAMVWRLLMRRSPTRSMTLVGDPAQTSEPGGCGSWEKILAPHMEDRWEHVRLGVNYRTPAEIMALAARVLEASGGGFEPPQSVRSTGVHPWAQHAGDLAKAAAEAVTRELGPEGRLAVIAPREHGPAVRAALVAAGHLDDAADPGTGVGAGGVPDLTRPVVLLEPRQAKGLEFDTVVIVEPADFGPNDLYVALTRPTQQLGIVYDRPLPAGLDGEGLAAR
ncbi:HelD family protein [Yinghuangia soli]|uniref:AAA family ATPase n=1 Tax=Yinghuangia soli TaxID=2908204 RepID=A0AA41Q3C1_9ACTN|nr:AAA family ATPase [Yinghuangia soli]MCF2529644.1 AAA family ATPase [Yinghuangia soli]